MASFSARANAIFSALGDAPAANGWQINTEQGYKPGAEDALDKDSSEDEDEPQPLPGAVGSDEEEEMKSRKASCAYMRAFEREEEEDDYDRMAVQQGNEVRPLRSMEVLDDNAFDRMHSQGYRSSGAAAEAAAARPETATTAAAHAEKPNHADVPAVAGQQAEASAMELDEDLPELEPVAQQQQKGHQQQQQQLEQEQQQPAKRHKPARGGVWVPPHRRPDYRPAEPAEQSHQQQQQQQSRRVRFADPAGAADGASHAGSSRGGQNQQQQQQQRGQQGWAGGSRGRGGRRGGSFVPDHVKNPQKYTVYTLDEPIYVGGQGGNDVDEAAGSKQWQQEQQQRLGNRAGGSSSSSSSGRVRRGDGSSGIDVGIGQQQGEPQMWQPEVDEPMMLDASTAAAAAAAAGADAGATGATEQAAAPQLPPAGAIKFQPSSKRVCRVDGVGSDSAAAAKATGALPGPGRAVFAQALAEEEEAAPADIDEMPAEGIASQSAGAGRKGRNRHYRSRATS